MVRILIFSAALVTCFGNVSAQDYRWQQRVEYKMDVRLDTRTHKLTGTQTLVYYNNSPDTLRTVYYHLYYNAFQPGSMMDVRSRTIRDPDRRVGSRIAELKDDEIGYQHIETLMQDKKEVKYTVHGTILKVELNRPILPKSKSEFSMTFSAQVPVQIRRTGRNNAEGIAYSMTQWYPKMAEYDHLGWHTYQYVAREFHGVWGDFDVTIHIDPSFVVAGTGVLQNTDQIGHGYQKPGTNVRNNNRDELAWHFVAENVHDFAWAADPDYKHDQVQVPGGPVLHFFYEDNVDTWKNMQQYAVKHFQYMSAMYGAYPYPVYSIIQGGDGGMEYPMCTLITGERTFGSLVGVVAHESAHSWFHGVLASNESLYAWMDEGFTEFSSNESMAAMFNQQNPHGPSYDGYINLVKSGLQEPVNQQSDQFNTNSAYSIAAYSMGEVFLEQLKYIIGEQNFYKGMKQYYNAWKFRHPEPNDFIRVMEKVSGIKLQWYMGYWINTTKTIDYGIRSLVDDGNSTLITLDRIGDFPMPVEVLVRLKNGTSKIFYIPTVEMLGSKPATAFNADVETLTAWPWVYPEYTLRVPFTASSIASVVLDPSARVADIEPKNDVIFIDEIRPFEDPTR